MKQRPIWLKILLSPISFIYWLAVSLRNWLFDIGVLNSQKFENVTIITIGNITMGGTGKTPFTEYLVRTLKDTERVAILSRGYKRKTWGFRLADENSTPHEIGDEPYQMKKKFPDVTVGVDSKRRRGIENMMDMLNPKPEVFLLDDAFQHRYVEPDLAVLLVDYNALITKDSIFPMGYLREPLRAKDRANIVIVTKCPQDVKPIELHILGKELNLYPYQSLYFTTMQYEAMKAISDKAENLSIENMKEYSALVVSGIAKPELFEEYVGSHTNNIETIRFADHHNFSKRDYKNINKKFDEITNSRKFIVTTEKDAVRMMNDSNLPDSIKSHIYYIPLTTKFITDEDKFTSSIRKHIDANKEYMRISEE